MSRAPTRTDYAALGLRPGAGDGEIRDAYRRLAKIHHPDRNPGDPQALATFARLSDSYAALRGRARTGSPTGATPLSAGSRRAPRRDEVPVVVTDLPVGGAAWVSADAVLVGPGRVATLRPSAAGAAFPSAKKVIRVERRADGVHVFIPPQPSARWPISEAAETEGMAVAALWIGDRQDRKSGDATVARMPMRLMTGTIAEMAEGDEGWVSLDALEVDADGNWTLDPAEPLGHAPHPDSPIRVGRDGYGYRVRSDVPATAWVASGAPGHDRIPVLDTGLGDLPPPPGPPAHPATR